MNRFACLRVLACSLIAAALGTAILLAAANPPVPPVRAEQWKKVDEAVNKGLPKTAIEELEPIIESAMKDKAYPEAIKAIAKKIALEGNIQGNKPEEKITRMKAEIAKAPDGDGAGDGRDPRPTGTGTTSSRTAGASCSGTADRRRAGRGLHDLGPAAPLRRDRQAVHEGPRRREGTQGHRRSRPTTPCWRRARLPDTYRPTLYDFLAFEALTFYTSAEQAGRQGRRTPSRSTPTSPIFAPAERVPRSGSRRRPTPTRRSSRRSSSTRTCSTFHKNDEDKIGLPRRRPAPAAASGTTPPSARRRTARYKAALKAFAEANADHELSAMARYRLAERRSTAKATSSRPADRPAGDERASRTAPAASSATT